MGPTLALTAVIAAGLAAAMTPVAGRMAQRVGLIDRPTSARAHTSPTPYLGGIAILAGIFVGVIAARTFVGRDFDRQLVVILGGASVMGVIGLLDDWRPRKPRWRILVEIALAGAVVAAGVQLRVTPFPWLNALVTVLWIVGVTNAINLLDNMDGLAAGSVAIAAAGCAFLAAQDGQRLVAVMAVAIAGAAVGFLVHNRPPARIFMGDAGALSLGYLLAVTVAKLRLVGSPGPLRLTVVALLCGVGILDTALVVLTRIRRGVSPFLGGTDHSSHRLVRAGLSSGRSVLALHALAAWFVTSAIIVRRLEGFVAPVALAVTGAIVLATLVSLVRLPAEGPLRIRTAADDATPADVSISNREPAEPATLAQEPVPLSGQGEQRAHE